VSVTGLLVRAGFARFGCIDSDVVEDTNLNRLPFYTDAIGVPKVDMWKRHVLAINPEATVQGWNMPLRRTDGDMLAGLLAGRGWEADEDPVDLVFLGTTDIEANLVAGRCCAQAHVRMIIGPASSGGWIVGTFRHGEGDPTLEGMARFGTESTALTDIDYAALAPAYYRAMFYPGRAGRLMPGVAEGMRNGTLNARSCGIFVRMTNAAMAFEAVKNVADMNGLPVDGTEISFLPRVRIFDPYSGCAYCFDAEKRAIGIPDWLTGGMRWEPVA
ncbi:MAG: ThiF family adenylyltransferase, partial [Mailhella sp.]|nr:ThiF family adenylyltransferase [Mailhella sp.]